MPVPPGSSIPRRFPDEGETVPKREAGEPISKKSTSKKSTGKSIKKPAKSDIPDGYELNDPKRGKLRWDAKREGWIKADEK